MDQMRIHAFSTYRPHLFIDFWLWAYISTALKVLMKVVHRNSSALLVFWGT